MNMETLVPLLRAIIAENRYLDAIRTQAVSTFPQVGETLFDSIPRELAFTIASHDYEVCEMQRLERGQYAIRTLGGWAAIVGMVNDAPAILHKHDGTRELTRYLTAEQLDAHTKAIAAASEREAALEAAVEFVLSAISNYGNKREAIAQAEEDAGLKFTPAEIDEIRRKAGALWAQGQREAGVTPLSHHDRAQAFKDLESGK